MKDLFKIQFDKLVLLLLILVFTAIGVYLDWGVELAKEGLAALLGLLTGHAIAVSAKGGGPEAK